MQIYANICCWRFEKFIHLISFDLNCSKCVQRTIIWCCCCLRGGCIELVWYRVVCSIQTAFKHLLCKKFHAKVEKFPKGFLAFVVIFPPLSVVVLVCAQMKSGNDENSNFQNFTRKWTFSNARAHATHFNCTKWANEANMNRWTPRSCETHFFNSAHSRTHKPKCEFFRKALACPLDGAHLWAILHRSRAALCTLSEFIRVYKLHTHVRAIEMLWAVKYKLH